MSEVENPMVRPIKEKEPKPVSSCKYCQATLFEDDIFLVYEGYYFCDDHCLIESLGIQAIEGWEI